LKTVRGYLLQILPPHVDEEERMMMPLKEARLTAG